MATLATLALPTAALAVAPYYADGVIHCPDGSQRSWSEIGKGPPIDITMSVTCNDLESARTTQADPPVASSLRGRTVTLQDLNQPQPVAIQPTSSELDADKKAKLDKMLKETLQLTQISPVAPITAAQSQHMADRQALDGQFGTMAKLRAAWRLGQTNILAEEAGRVAFYLALILVVWLLFRRKKAV